MGTSLKKVAKKTKEYKYVLLAMRHAKTEPFGGNGSDVGRELTDKGRKQAKAVAKGLAAFKMVPTRIACSSATRARTVALAGPACEKDSGSSCER